MRKRLCILLFLCPLLLWSCGSSTQNSAGEMTTEEPASSEQDFGLTGKEEGLAKIRERGYLIVGIKTDVPGFGYYDEETKAYSGMEVELSYEMAAEIFGTTPEEAEEQELVHFKEATVENRSTLLIENAVDCLAATYTITEERKEIFLFSKSYYTDFIGLMVQKDYSDNSSLGNSAITSIAQLDGKKVGVASGSDTREHMLNYFTQRSIQATPEFYEYASYEDLYKALKNDSIDVFAVDVSILNAYCDDTLTILPYRFSPQDYGVAASKNNRELIDVANTVIEKYGYTTAE